VGMDEELIIEQLDNLQELTEDIESNLGDVYDIISILEEQLIKRS
jgi:hypothetical protein